LILVFSIIALEVFGYTSILNFPDFMKRKRMKVALLFVIIGSVAMFVIEVIEIVIKQHK